MTLPDPSKFTEPEAPLPSEILLAVVNLLAVDAFPPLAGKEVGKSVIWDFVCVWLLGALPERAVLIAACVIVPSVALPVLVYNLVNPDVDAVPVEYVVFVVGGVYPSAPVTSDFSNFAFA